MEIGEFFKLTIVYALNHAEHYHAHLL